MMDSSLALELKGISKTFKVKVRNPNKKSIFSQYTEKVENKVLDSIDLIIKKGEILGVIGLNGSGKSTLLSIISKIMEPDSGTVEVDGKISSILELGMGFHNDLSGRENIYIKGELYGFTKKQIDERIENIIDFSGVRSYIDNPLRTYSSGMKARLAFSIMINVDADIMVLDEIMSTGDASFTAKANLHFKEHLKDGKTVVFASQSLPQIIQLCTRAIWINKGKIVADGDPKEVCDMMQKSIDDSLEMIIDTANHGVSDSQYKLAIMYRDGVNVEKDYDAYKSWLEKAALSKHVMAMVLYADLLIEDESRKDEAMGYYRAAASKGNLMAKIKLSTLLNDSDANKKREEIKNILKSIADKDITSGKYQLGLLMLKTALDPEEQKEGIRILEECSREGNSDAAIQVANCYKDGFCVVKNLEKYVEFMELAVECGNVSAIVALANAYYNGKLVPKDDKKAFEYSYQGAIRGNSEMQFMLATLYFDGIGTEKNIGESDKWFGKYFDSILSNYQIYASKLLRNAEINDVNEEELLLKAAESFNPSAIDTMLSWVKGGKYTPSNKEKFMEYCEMAALTSTNRKMILADMYYEGILFDQNYSKAVELYESCDYLLDGKMDYRLYLVYHDGLGGIVKNEHLANKYLMRSATKGFSEATKKSKMKNN